MKTTNIQQSTVRRRMKSLRIDMGITQGDLAKAAGVDRKTVNRIENGHFSPSLTRSSVSASHLTCDRQTS